MKKTVVISSVITTSFLISQFTAIFAADLSTTYDSNTSINFEPNTDPTDPVDPTNPNNPFEPDNPAQPGTNGPLSLDYASNLDFGTQKITTKDNGYYGLPTQGLDSNGERKSVPNYVQVTDNTGSNQGWKLTVTQQNEFVNTTTNSTLKGAQILFGNGNAITATSSDAGLISATRAYNLSPNVTETVATASANSGQGTWVIRYGTNETMSESTALYVPGPSVKEVGSYETTLKWELAQTPTETIN